MSASLPYSNAVLTQGLCSSSQCSFQFMTKSFTLKEMVTFSSAFILHLRYTHPVSVFTLSLDFSVYCASNIFLHIRHSRNPANIEDWAFSLLCCTFRDSLFHTPFSSLRFSPLFFCPVQHGSVQLAGLSLISTV